MLLATVVGCQVFGAFWDGSSVSGPVSLLLMPKDPRRGQEEVARVLSSLNSAIDDLIEYYKVEDIEEGLRSCDLGPLEGMRRMSYDWLFTAQLLESTIVVKFVNNSYGQVVHEILARQGYGPHSSFGYNGGWYAGKVDGDAIDSPTSQVAQSLRAAVRLMHDKGYVHGDLRPQNIGGLKPLCFGLYYKAQPSIPTN